MNAARSALAALLVLSGCNASTALGPLSVATEWRLIAIESADPALEIAALPVVPTLRLTPDPNNPTRGTLSGFSGCNKFTANYALQSGDRITVGALVTTYVGCAPSTGLVQAALYHHLGRVARYRVVSDTFELMTDEAATLRFAAKEEARFEGDERIRSMALPIW